MGSERRHAMGGSLSRCTSVLGCFHGAQESYEPVSSAEEAGSDQSKSSHTVLRLGSKSPRRCFSFVTASKLKEACGQALEAAKKGSPHIRELFVGGQLFVQVAPPKFGPKPYRQRVSPSIGFLHMAPSSSMDSSLDDR